MGAQLTVFCLNNDHLFFTAFNSFNVVCFPFNEILTLDLTGLSCQNEVCIWIPLKQDLTTLYLFTIFNQYIRTIRNIIVIKLFTFTISHRDLCIPDHTTTYIISIFIFCFSYFKVFRILDHTSIFCGHFRLLNNPCRSSTNMESP